MTCENCGEEVEFLEYCAECDVELCDACWDEEGHEEHDEGLPQKSQTPRLERDSLDEDGLDEGGSIEAE